MRAALLNLLDEVAELRLNLCVELFDDLFHLVLGLRDLGALILDNVVNVRFEVAPLHLVLLAELLQGHLNLVALLCDHLLDRVGRFVNLASQSANGALPFVAFTFFVFILNFLSNDEIVLAVPMDLLKSCFVIKS